MVKSDLSQWPIVYMKVDGLATVADMEEYLHEMETIVGRNEKFGLIFLSDISDEQYNSFKREKEAQKLSNEWLKANRARMGKLCVGIALVTKASGIMKLFKPIAKLTLKRTMGASGDIFFSREEAAAWMARQI